MALNEFKLLVKDLRDSAQLLIDVATGGGDAAERKLAVLSQTRETKILLDRIDEMIFEELGVDA